MLYLVILRVLESYFRHRWLYLLPIVMMIGASIVYYMTTKPTYMSGGVVYVQQDSLLSTLNSINAEGFSWTTPAEVTTQEFNELLQTDSFIRAIIQQTDLEAKMSEGRDVVEETIANVRESIAAAPIGSNQVGIAATNEEAQIAYQLVNAAIDAQLRWKITNEQNDSEAAQEFFVQQVAIYQSELESARTAMEDYLRTHPAPIRGDRPALEQLEIDRLQSEIDLASSRYASALEKEENARLAMAQVESDARQTYFLVDAPVLPDEPQTSLKDVAINMVIIVMVGVMLSVGGIIGGALLDRSLRFPIDVRHGLNLPVLSSVPQMIPADGKKKRVRAGKTQPVVEADDAASTELTGTVAT